MYHIIISDFHASLHIFFKPAVKSRKSNLSHL